LSQPNQIEVWLNSVAYGHSQSKATRDLYKSVWRRFSKFADMTAEETIKDYEKAEKKHIPERTIKRKHSQKIQQWIIELTSKGLTSGSIKTMVGTVMSFYKYNDLSLGHIPQAKGEITYHNKDIEKDEIIKIMALSNIREKAIFAIMAQAGLRPHTIKQLKIKHIEKILEPNTPIPAKIEIPKEIEKGKFGRHPTFMAEEAIKYTKQYLATRTNLTPESPLFTTKHGKPINTKNTSRTFRLIARKLKESGAINYQINKGKPSELRLYNLRKYFRKHATQMGFEYVNYLMGHTTKGSDSNYIPKDDEFYRKLYEDNAMEFLRFDEPTPTESTKIIKTLNEQHKKQIETIRNQYKNENKELRNRLTKIENIIISREIEFNEPSPEDLKQAERKYKKAIKWEKEHPEELKKREIREKEIEKYQDVPAEIEEKGYSKCLEAQLSELKNQISELRKLIKQDKK